MVPEANVQPLEVRTVPDQLANTLSHIVRQIDVLTQTMSILEVIHCDLESINVE